MAEKLGCPHAVDENGVVRCNLIKKLEESGLKISQLDHTLTPYTLALSGGGGNTRCGFYKAFQRSRCIGSHVPKDRVPKLMDAVWHGTVLIHSENRLTWALIFDAAADKFLQILPH